ncbi:MAG: hypothetical protein EHM80_13800 [Nitrospiraceae bacterium]|nr:MAG: hypothetical protein EHM80_13800 [Nitrospiraceae bacterium]
MNLAIVIKDPEREERFARLKVPRFFPRLLHIPQNQVAAPPFRVTRDSDPAIEEDEATDLLSAIRESLRRRHFGSAVRLEVNEQMPERIRQILLKNLQLVPRRNSIHPPPRHKTIAPDGRQRLVQSGHRETARSAVRLAGLDA